MAFTVSFTLPREQRAGEAFTFTYRAVNGGPDDSGHMDRVRVLPGSIIDPVDFEITAPATATNGHYDTSVDVPGLPGGSHEIWVEIPGSPPQSTAIYVVTYA